MSKKAPSKGAAATSLAGHPTEDIISLARGALLELTALDTFGVPPVVTATEGVVTVDFPNTQPGYPGWVWSVSVNDYAEMAPTVLELQMVPSTGALVSPAWVPWADRMEEYLANEKEIEAQAAADTESDLDDEDDDVDFDLDVDGVDIDELDLDPDAAPWETPVHLTDVFDHVEFDEPDALDP